MRINNIYFDNFRNIKKCNLQVKDSNIILGKNNSGKSSVLKAIFYSINLILNFNYYARKGITENSYRYMRTYENLFDSSKDMRIETKSPIKKNTSTFEIEFELNEDELLEINTITKNTYDIKNILSFEIIYTNEFEFYMRIKTNMNGRYSTNYNKIRNICNFLHNRINVDYIPSIRTEEDINSLIDDLVDDQLRQLNQDQEYNDAYQIIQIAHQKKLEELSNYLSIKLKKYLPDVKKININVQGKRRINRENYNLNINDGVETSIDTKGDGIKSLVAMSLLQKSTDYTTNLLLIDEPEAHLHSSAIKELKDTINTNVKNSTIFISTHSSIFVDRNNLTKNYIVNEGSVNQVYNIKEIREILGVSLYENLINSELVILVEGATDQRILNHSLHLHSEKMAYLLDNGTVLINDISGTNNLKMFLELYRSLFCKVIVLLDYEHNTKNLIKEFVSANLIDNNHVLYNSFEDLSESELENQISGNVIIEAVKKVKCLDISNNFSIHKDKKWSRQIYEIIKYNHREIFEDDIDRIKMEIMSSSLRFSNLDFLNDSGKRLVTSLSQLIEDSL